MTQKKIIVFVEGNDDSRLITDLANNISTKSIEIKCVYGDIFSQQDKRRRGDHIASSTIENYLEKSKLNAQDLLFVAFLIDVDGIFIDRNNLTVDDASSKNYFVYNDDQTVTFGSENKKKDVIKKWELKNKRLEYLQKENFKLSFNKHSGTRSKIEIPVRVYFNNIHLEHVLNESLIRGMANADEKSELVAEFIEFINSKEMPVLDTYKNFFKPLVHDTSSNEECWNYVQRNPWKRTSSLYFFMIDLVDFLDKFLGNVT
ncbi:hypothetical protein ACT5YT_08105 [Leuconostoc suionicum]|uniref:hypothetical protein n=1 Tax=Leuconostoc suionicum TaxID=1511761 RepID=UPI0040361512